MPDGPARTPDAEPEAELRSMAQARVGATLRGKWHLDAVLGVGGMAAVYAATHRNGTRAAVKILHRELSLDPRLRRRFLREGEIANAVGHGGAVRILDDDTAEDGSLYLVTELLEGENLEDRCARCGGRLSEDEVLSIADQILDVLIAAHARDLVHRDLKPANVFVTCAGGVKVLDFGIARARGLASQTQATAAGSTLGTPAYMAPEQARGLMDEIDARTDLWAVGATMFRMLSDKLVHEGRTASEELLSAMTKPAPPLASVVPHVSPAVADVVDRALAFDRAQRWPDAATMQQAVRAAYEALHKLPISSAPHLKVPFEASHTKPPGGQSFLDYDDISMSDTVAADSASVTARAPHTTAGLVSPKTGGGSQATGPRSRLRSRVIPAAIAALCVGAGVAAWFVVARAGRFHASTAGIASTVSSSVVSLPAADSAPPPQPAAASVTSEATTPPSSQAGAPSAAAAGSTKKSTWQPGGRKANCTPPYVIDPVTGKKNWKAECL